MPAEPTPREILARLVAIDTTSAKPNVGLVDLVCDLVDGPTVSIHRQTTDDGAKANLVVRAGPDPGPDREGLVLCGHTDVVPAEEPGWRSDPFALAERDGDLVGRGACDMKGFLALAIGAFRAAAAGGLARPLALVLTHDEEAGTRGARRIAEEWDDLPPLPKRTIVGEPTGLAVARAHKGHVRVRVVVHGVAAHSATPALGRSAIEPAARAILALAELREALARERPAGGAAFPDVPYVTLNVGRVKGGVADNVVPDRCAIDLGMRNLPGMDAAPLVARAALAVAAALDGVPHDVEIVNESPAMALPEGTDLERELKAWVGQTAPATVPFATDGGWLQRLGLECVVWGPGSIEVAHKANEFVPAAELERARGLVDRAVRRWCAA